MRAVPDWKHGGQFSRLALVRGDRHLFFSSRSAWESSSAGTTTAPSHPEAILIATGSELSIAVQAHETLLAEGIHSRVVSMPSWDLFDRQPQACRDSVLPPTVKARVAVEQASTLGWERYVGDAGRVIGMRTFGASAPLRSCSGDSVSSRTVWC